MAQPSQVFPPWLTQVITTVTDDAGLPIETQTTVLFLPLTYYGPSIPLGPDWTYGGLTSPASTSITAPTSTTSGTETTPTTSSLPTISSSSISSSSSLSSSLPSTSLTPTSSSSTNSATSVPAGDNGLPKNQLIGIIVGAILGFIFLFVFILVTYLCLKSRRKKQAREIEDDYDFVEQSPRHSGEEADPFLQRSGSQGAQQQQMREMGVGGRVIGGTGPTLDNSMSSGASSSTGSGYGTVLAKPTIAGGPGIALAMSHSGAPKRGPILSREELRRLSEEDMGATDSAVSLSRNSLRAVPPAHGANDEEILPLMPPPRLNDPTNQTRSPSRLSVISQGSAAEAKLMTARRVKAEDLEPRTPLTRTGDLPSTLGKKRSSLVPGWLGGLLGVASSSGHQGGEAETSELMSSSHDDYQDFPPPPPIPRLGLLSAERPISSVSAKSGLSAQSGSTVYHDARDSPYSSSSARGTPELQAPKGVVARTSSAAEMGYWVGRSAGGTSAPGSTSNLRQTHTPPSPLPETRHPAHARSYDGATLTTISSSYSNTPLTNPHPHTQGDVDVLDMPVPKREPSFSSLTVGSTAGSSNDSYQKKKWPYPPGLMPTVQVWNETDGETPSPGSYAASAGGNMSLDLDLDAEPPRAREGWRSLARGFGDDERRGTFGLALAPLVQNPPELESEAASIHTHMTRLQSSSGSNPSAHFRSQTGSTGSSSSRIARSMLSGHSGSASFSSDSHRHRHLRGPGHLSPIFGQPLTAAAQEPYTSSPRRSPPPPIPIGPASVKVGGAPISPPPPVVTRSDHEELEMPWAAGLTENWSPT